jgi:hypothetical protein
MSEAGGYVDVDTTYERGKPQVDIYVKRDRAADLGVSPLAVASTIKALIGGDDVSKFKAGGDRYDVSVRLEEPFRNRPEDISRPGPPRAVGRAVVAVMAQPDVRVRHQAILQAPYRPGHLLPGEGMIVGGQRAGGGAGPALEAHLEGISPSAAHSPDEIQVWVHHDRLAAIGGGWRSLGDPNLRGLLVRGSRDLSSLHRRSSSSYSVS